jgi:hypothetical protein
MTQQEALNIMKTGANVFLTGEPGSGKTHVVNEFVEWFRAHGVEPAVTASTGIAATHIGGFTIHSWSGIGVRRHLGVQDLRRIAENRRLAKRIVGAHTLIIDEISMLSARTFAMVEQACRFVRGGTEPFGGLQVIVVGDFFQLPPVVNREDQDSDDFSSPSPRGSERGLAFDSGEGTPPNLPLSAGGGPASGGERGGSKNSIFAFNSSAWRSLNLNVCYLSEQHRQEDAVFLEMLSAIRNGVVADSHQALLASRRMANPVAETVTKLFSHNMDVDRFNDAELRKLPGEAEAFTMESRGPKNLVESLKKGCLSPEILSLKVGARVMFTKNDIPEHRFVNGTLGVVEGFYEENGMPVVRTPDGRTIYTEQQDWRIEEGGQILARITQVPLRLAWAITVHKSQGMSLDAAHMDLRTAFEYGQGYVALSRLRTLAGLSLAGWNERALEVHPEILLKDSEFHAASAVAQQVAAKISTDELLSRQNGFIKACGGSVEEQKVEPGEKSYVKPAKKVKAKKWERTLELIRQGMTVEDIAAELSRAQSTIVGHIEELYVLGKLEKSNLESLSLRNRADIARVHEAFREIGADHFKPIFEHFKGDISYNVIHLARLTFEE